MSTNTKLDRLAERYNQTDTSQELTDATAATSDSPAAAERMTTFAVRLPVTVLDYVREVASQRGITTSALVRRWIDAGIATDARDADDRVVPVQELLELISRAPRENAAS